jgi:CheY-like chemotaxis protein
MFILYVEDHIDTARAMQKLLETHGHQVMLAHTAREAKAACADEVFDLWLLDIGLPDAHGGELLRALRRMADTPAIAITAHSQPQEIAEGEDDGFEAYLIKPITLPQLLGTIDWLAA